jgi:hypothetical protein
MPSRPTDVLRRSGVGMIFLCHVAQIWVGKPHGKVRIDFAPGTCSFRCTRRVRFQGLEQQLGMHGTASCKHTLTNTLVTTTINTFVFAVLHSFQLVLTFHLALTRKTPKMSYARTIHGADWYIRWDMIGVWRIHGLVRGVTAGYLALTTSSLLYILPQKPCYFRSYAPEGCSYSS